MLYSLFTFGCVSDFQNKDFSPTLEVLSQADDWLINEGSQSILNYWFGMTRLRMVG